MNRSIPVTDLLVTWSCAGLTSTNTVTGYSFAAEHVGETQRVEIKAKQDDKYHVEYADGNEDHLMCAEIINLPNKETEDTIYGHSRKPSTID